MSLRNLTKIFHLNHQIKLNQKPKNSKEIKESLKKRKFYRNSSLKYNLFYSRNKWWILPDDKKWWIFLIDFPITKNDGYSLMVAKNDGLPKISFFNTFLTKQRLTNGFFNILEIWVNLSWTFMSKLLRISLQNSRLFTRFMNLKTFIEIFIAYLPQALSNSGLTDFIAILSLYFCLS